jgi:hypothetical protein
MNNFLLPYRWKLAGIAISAAGAISALIYILFDFKFKMPVFAVYSSFLETKTFETFKTNVAEEITLSLLIIGLSLVVFSKEKNESEGLDPLRFKAMARAIIVNNIFLLFSVLFIFGTGFIAVLVVNVVSLLVFYLAFFYLGKRKLNV